jgi:glyoxylase-like metal-dependent hydrolase (beta-lactamase superfamily II)
MSAEDSRWLNRKSVDGLDRRLIEGSTEKIIGGVTAIKTGGHFDGSLVMLWKDELFIADSLFTVQVGNILQDSPKALV